MRVAHMPPRERRGINGEMQIGPKLDLNMKAIRRWRRLNKSWAGFCISLFSPVGIPIGKDLLPGDDVRGERLGSSYED